MSAFRRLRTSVIAVLLVLLAAPAVTACCVWSVAPMPCCTEKSDHGLASACCVDDGRQSPDRPMPGQAAKSLRFDSTAVSTNPATSFAALAPLVVAAGFDGFADPPGSDRLYLRLSVIRR